MTISKDPNLNYLIVKLTELVSEKCIDESVKQILIDKYKNSDLETKKSIYFDILSQAPKLLINAKNIRTSAEALMDLTVEELVKDYSKYVAENPNTLSDYIKSNSSDEQYISPTLYARGETFSLDDLLNRTTDIAGTQQVGIPRAFDHSSNQISNNANLKSEVNQSEPQHTSPEAETQTVIGNSVLGIQKNYRNLNQRKQSILDENDAANVNSPNNEVNPDLPETQLESDLENNDQITNQTSNKPLKTNSKNHLNGLIRPPGVS